MKKTISKKPSDIQRVQLISTLKHIFTKSEKSLKLIESKTRPFTYGFYEGSAQLIWLFVRENETYNYLYDQKGSELIDTSTAFGIIPNNFDPVKFTLPTNYKSGFEITLYEEVSTLQKKVDILNWSANRSIDELSKALGAPKLFFLYPALSETVKEKVLLSVFKSKSQKNTFAYKGFVDIENRSELLNLIIAHYLIEFPSKKGYGLQKAAVATYVDIYKEITGKSSGITRYSTLKGWDNTFSRISDLAPFCFYNKSLQRIFA